MRAVAAAPSTEGWAGLPILRTCHGPDMADERSGGVASEDLEPKIARHGRIPPAQASPTAQSPKSV